MGIGEGADEVVINLAIRLKREQYLKHRSALVVLTILNGPDSFSQRSDAHSFDVSSVS